MATVSEPTIPKAGLDPITIRTLDAFRRRRGMLLLLRAAGVGMLVFVSLAFTLATLDYLMFFSDGVRWALSIGIYVATALSMWLSGIGSFRSRDPLELARHVESVSPSLRENLVSAVELADPNSSNGSLYFRKLLQSRVARRISKVDVGHALPLSLVRRWVLSGASVVAICIAMLFIPSAQFGRRFARAALPGFAIERASNTKVTILEPSPPTRYVAQRDAVGVIVNVQAGDSGDVMLHWRSADGTSGESVMTPRMDSSEFQPGSSPDNDIIAEQATTDSLISQSQTDQTRGGRFAANLSIGSVPLQYRITAGDAITLWHELTPLPRPRVIRFEKVYRLPAYAQLADRIADEEHGDLKALQGSTAEVTVTFDQRVENPVIRFGVRGARSEMEAIDDSGTKFLARISIKTSGQYQVDATSSLSGLNNPFSPTNMITPVLDTPPAVRWSDSTKPKQLVSSLDVIELSAIATDDLPLDRIVQEVQVNEDPFGSYPLPLDSSDRKIELAWSWDLMNRLGASSQTPQLSAGDLVKTRLVAIDRRGTRSESTLIEFLIAGDGFDADRHQFLEPFSKQTSRIMAWADQSKTLAKSIAEIGKSDNDDSLPEIINTWKSLQQESVSLIKNISESLAATQNTASASMTELVGRAILDIETRLDGQIKQMQWLSEHRAEKLADQWARSQKQNCTQVGRDAEQTAYQCERLSEFSQMQFSLALTASLYSDVTMLRDNVNRLVDDMPKQRVPRYLTLVAGQMAEIDRLIEQYDALLSQESSQHLAGDHWSRWSERWTIQIQRLMEDQPHRDQILAVLRSLRDEIKDKPQHVVHSGIHNTALRWGRDIRKEMLYLTDLTRRVLDAGRAWRDAKSKAQRDNNADDAIVSGLNSNWCELKWNTELNRLIVRAAGQEKLNRAKSKIDLAYAADQSLFVRAVKNVTESGFQDYNDQPADRVLDSIADAISVLQATSDISAAREDWLSIREGESQDDASPLRKMYHPLWLKLQDIRIELGVRYLRQSNVDWKTVLESIDATRYNDDHNQANSRIDSRQWSMDPMISAAKPLESLARDLQIGLDALAPKREEARETLRRYVLTLSQQAREAAEEADRAKQATDQRSDASEKSLRQVQPQQNQAVDKATDTIEALIDRANTTDILDDQAREVARDADVAAELIAEAVKDTKDAIQEASGEKSTASRDDALESVEHTLEQLADRLRQTAEHFERIENGEDVAESRQQLRQAADQLKTADQIDERYDRANEMADTAKQSPRELLRQLEEELKRNEPMQDALSDIAADLVRDAAENLSQAAKEEDALQRRLESEDDAFAEQKRQRQLLLDEFSSRAKTLRDRTLVAASKAAGWANDPQMRDKLDEIRQQLNESIDKAESISRGQPTLTELQAAAQKLRQDVLQASDAADQVSKQLADRTAEDLHGDKKKRNAAADSMQRSDNQLRNDELRALDQQRNKWSSIQQDAGRRIRTAEQQQRQAETAVKREQDKLEKDPQNEWIKKEIQRQRDVQDEATRTIEQTRKTSEMAADRIKRAVERANAINQAKATPLDMPNPAAELGEKLARNAAQRLEDLAQELEQLNAQSEIASDLRASSESAQTIANQQQSVLDDVQAAADDLARAARHEARLENASAAEQLAQAAEQTQQKAGQAAENAGQQLREAVQENSKSSDAGASLQQASEAIAEQAKSLQSLLGQSQSDASDSAAEQSSQQPDSQSASAGRPASADATQPPRPQSGQSPSNQQAMPPGQQPSAAQPNAQQMAQTLDDLDRSLAAQANQSGQSQGAPDSPGQAQSGAEGQPSNGQSGGEPSSPGQLGTGQPPKNAVEASPTLAQMLEAQMQQAARERMQSLQQAQTGQQPGEPSNSDSSSPNPASESGEGEMPPGADEVDLLRGAIGDGDWGDLRRRGVEDAAQGRSSRIPPGYSREVNAYFKALSKRAAESKE